MGAVRGSCTLIVQLLIVLSLVRLELVNGRRSNKARVLREPFQVATSMRVVLVNGRRSNKGRVLHEPFQVASPVPAPGPSAESPPRIPSNEPFFPLSPSYSPPSPPDQAGSSSGTSIPGNVNGNVPQQPNTKASSAKNDGGHRSSKVVVAIVVCVCVLILLCLLLGCLHRKKLRNGWESSKLTDETPLTSTGATPGNGRVLSPAKVVALNGGSDVLYLGTFANRTANSGNDTLAEDRSPANPRFVKTDNESSPHSSSFNHPPHPPTRFPPSPSSPRFAPPRQQRFPNGESILQQYGRGSPEIHPLPPLSKKPRPAIPTDDSSDEESFYSPRCPSSSSKSNNASPKGACKRLFSPPLQQKPVTQSVISFSSSASSSSSSSPTPSSPSLDSPPAAPITPTVFTPPMRAHSNSPSRQQHSLNNHSRPANFQATQQSKRPPPPPPPPPPPFKTPVNLPTQNSEPPSFKSASSASKDKSDPPSPTLKTIQSSLPPLPMRPPRFISSSRSGRLSNGGSPSSKNPPSPPPPPHNSNSPLDIPLPPPPSRSSFRPHSAAYSARTGHSSQNLKSASDDSPPGSSVARADSADSDQTPKPKLKPLHWDKVRSSADRAMVWDQLKSGSFQINEEMIETLFVCNTPTPAKNDASRRSSTSPAAQNQRLLDPRKSQNIAILLRALNVTKEEVCDALMDGTYDSISTDLLETLSKMAPAKDEEMKLKEYNGDITKLGSSERFLKALLEIPFAFKRVDAMLYRANFEEEVICIKKSLQTLETACEELRSSRLFIKLLEAVLKTGNRMNVGTIRGDAQAFKLDTLLKLVDVKGTDGKTTLLHFVVLEIIRVEGARVATTKADEVDSPEAKNQQDRDNEYKKLGLQVVASLSTELGNVKKAAGMDSDALSSSVFNLARGLGKLKEILQTIQGMEPKEGERRGNFLKSMSSFVEQAERNISQIQAEEKRAFARLRETTEYFHGDAAKEEGRPLRIFMVVRDFLGILDQVCREIGRTQIKDNRLSSGQSVPPPVIAHAIAMPVFPSAYGRRYDSSEDESSSA